MNELLLIINVFFIYFFTLLCFRYFGYTGLFISTVISTICANIEVMILIKAFYLEQTLGNILFASTFLCSDIASEIYGKKVANKLVNCGIITSIFFIVLSQMWLLYIPSSFDSNASYFHIIFKNTPRIMIVGLIVYAISQKFDVFMYEFIWKKTDKKFGDHDKYLWLRNNGSTFISQFLNTVLFTLGAFYGSYPNAVLINILYVSYIIFVVLAFLDTGFLYIARYLYKNKFIREVTLIEEGF